MKHPKVVAPEHHSAGFSDCGLSDDDSDAACRAFGHPNFQPLILPDCPPLDSLRSPEYRRFIRRATIEAGLRFFMRRQTLDRSWPFLDTKFNPNTGRELPPSARNVIHTWLLGRGVESLALHLEQLDSLALSDSEKAEARVLFLPVLRNMCRAIVEIAERNRGRIPFAVGRDLVAIGDTPDPSLAGPSDLFCGKGLLMSPAPSERDAGLAMLEVVAERISCGAVEASGDPSGRGKISQAMRMLFLSVPRLLDERLHPVASNGLRGFACDFIAFVMDRHYDRQAGRFSEWIDPATGERGHYLDPGHCTEFVGLAYSALRSMDGGDGFATGERNALRAKAKEVLPQILLSAVAAGFNERWGGICKALDNRTGRALDASMPWWNLPETMRAALFAAEESSDQASEDECLRVFAKCHNAYFTNYPNRANGLFPFQTRSGETGEVLDAAPAVPEGDPLYHTNLCVFEILSILETKSSRND